jgi:hypothetical protein
MISSIHEYSIHDASSVGRDLTITLDIARFLRTQTSGVILQDHG